MKGLLLVNMGTPDAPDSRSVRRFLRELLSDPLVLDMPAPWRRLLLELFILPSRPRRAAEAYRRIWTDRGSPLLVHSRDLAQGVAARLGVGWRVEPAMRYGHPSIESALSALGEAGVDDVVLLPLYPQHAASTRGSAIEAASKAADRIPGVASLKVVPPFYEHPGFIEAVAGQARDAAGGQGADHVLFSFHGLPERQILEADPTGAHCLRSADCCVRAVRANRNCYKFHCHRTAESIASALGLGPMGEGWSISFQSRMGRVPWLRPFTEEVVLSLASKGAEHLAVICPSFVADCLETLEEIGMRAREMFERAGGERLTLVPCVNAHPVWVEAVAAMVTEAGRGMEVEE